MKNKRGRDYLRPIYEEVIILIQDQNLFIDNFSQGIVYGFCIGRGLSQQESEIILGVFVENYLELKYKYKKEKSKFGYGTY